jgi:hypothetical protein
VSDEDLFSEIRQIMEQYGKEVRGKRARIPESVWERVGKLHQAGYNSTAIANRTGLKYFTILRWKRWRDDGGFQRLPVTTRGQGLIEKTDTVTVATQSTKAGTVTVTTPKGIKIEGVSEALLLNLIGRLEGQ